MPLDLKTIDTSRRMLQVEDRGILVQTKPRGNVKNPIPDVLFWLRSYANDYWESKCPGEIKEEEEKEKEETGDDEAKSETKSPKKPKHRIQFVARDLGLANSLVFVSTNLDDIADYLHFIFNIMAASKGERRTKYPFRVMPVLGCCVPKPREMEAMLTPILEQLVGDQEPYRFSIQFYGSMDAENMTQKEAAAVLRSCIWSVNPNCIQCLKYQDFAFTIDILKPFFCFGYLYDFIKLRRYKSLNMKMGYDLSGEGDDSEDDISDDPTLDDDAEKNRKMRIKRKRNAEKAGMTEENGESKKSQDESIMTEDGNEEEDADGDADGEADADGDADASVENGEDD